MNIQRATSVNELLARILFLILPTAVAGYFILHTAFTANSVIGDYQGVISTYLPNFVDQALLVDLYFSIAMVASAVFYAFRFRFFTTAIILYFVLYFAYKGIDSMVIGEFDTPKATFQVIIFSVFFSLGWLIGWGFMRVRYMSVIIATCIVIPCIYLIAKTFAPSTEADEMFRNLVKAFSLPILYSVYIVFAAEQIYNYKDKSQKFWWFLIRRVGLFTLLAALLLGGVLWLRKDAITADLKDYGGGGKQGKNSMLKKDSTGHFDLEDYSRLTGSLGRSNELLFCAHIDNFFPDKKTPNPLYLTNRYYTKFDTLTETFTPETPIPSNDLFLPNPAMIPLFSTRTDSSVIANSMGPKLRKTVEIEVYTNKLSPAVFVAPSTAFFVQPITIEKDFRKEFQSAYRAKSYVSELNSAYFIYNTKDTQIKAFQEKRFEVLRQVTSYSSVADSVIRYYTFMPHDEKFNRIGELARKVTANAKTPVDKILAIRDYFLSKDSVTGERLFRYTDNPGIPDLPSASKLQYFLFESHQGYCAYYAGATLFMLRSLGIPSRIAVGFLTVDRSDKNKGWYWYYADQAHAWTQVYFPGYGWLDFDTTVGNDDKRDDQHDSPQPDQTPPMQPPKAWLAADGVVESIDTAQKLVRIKVNHFVFHDKEYTVDPEADMMMDVHIASIRKDSMEVPLSVMQKGDLTTSVSYAEALKNMSEVKGEEGTTLAKRLPSPAPIDEIYIKKKLTKEEKEKLKKEEKEKHVSYKMIFFWIGFIVGLLICLFFALPRLIFNYYRISYNRADPSKNRSYWAYRAATFYLHQVGIFRERVTPMYYARNTVDPMLETNFVAFMNIYLKQKYAKQPLTGREQDMVTTFLRPFLQQVKKKVPAGKRFWGFLNPIRSFGYFVQPDEE